MNDEVLLSVCVITYNQEKSIGQTLDSILSQGCEFRYEIVIGDDCSSDNTRKIIESYKAKYPDIIKTIFNESNLGILRNYFNVINSCSGKYIMECAGDDYWLPGKVSIQIKYMEDHQDVGMCYGHAKLFSEEDNVFSRSLVGSSEVSFFELLNFNSIPALTVCLKNELVQKYINEVQPLDHEWMMEDYPMWLWFSKESIISFINESFGVYVERKESVSHSQNKTKKVKFNLSMLEVQKFYCEKYGFQQIFEEKKDEIYFYNAMILNDRKKISETYRKLKNKHLTYKQKIKVFLSRFYILFNILYNFR